MPQLRKDPIVDRWVIISTERGRRPSDFEHEHVNEKKGGFCPFCEDNERTTPPEILAFRDPSSQADSPGWTLRVVPNKFPALHIEGEMDKEGEGLYDKMNGLGAHEIIIESPDHNTSLAGLSLKRTEDVFWAYRDRVIDLKKDHRLKYVLLFKNEGSSAGASLEHTHSQLIALPIVPKRVIEEIAGSKKYYSYKERCIYCDIIKQEQESKNRVAIENEHFIATCPFAPRFPFETWILPKRHNDSFEHTSSIEFSDLAKIMKELLMRLDKLLNIPPYNYIIHTSPLRQDVGEFYHWHIEIMPKLTKVAGFEWGSGFYINPTSPEDAAKALREVRL